jgi:membrane protein required for colicin V production
MNLFDMSILGIVNFCLINGIFRGLIKEGISLMGVIVGFCAACYYYDRAAALLSVWISNEIYLRILGFLIVFLGIVIITNVLMPMIKYMVGLDFIWGVDRSFGGGIGIIKGLFVCCMMLIIFTAFLPKGTSYIAESTISRYLLQASEKIIIVSPRQMKHEFTEKIEIYKKTWKMPRNEPR